MKSLMQNSKTKIDNKIIGLLFEDSRLSFADIAQQLNISRNAVWNRYNKLVKEGIITGSTVQINYKKLGYDAVATILLDVDPSKLEEVNAYIKTEIPNAFGPFIRASTYNMRFVVTLKTISEIGKIKEEIRKKLGIVDIGSSLWTDVWFTPENLSLLPIRPIQLSNKKSTDITIFDVDDLYLKIIGEMADDSQKSFRFIAKKLKVSVYTIIRRYETLKNQGIIVPRIQINPAKIGYSAQTNFSMRILPNYNIDDVIKEIIPLEDVFYIMKCTGEFNLNVLLMVKNTEDLLRSGDYFGRIPGIKRIETMPSATSPKWPLPRTYTSTVSRNLA